MDGGSSKVSTLGGPLLLRPLHVRPLDMTTKKACFCLHGFEKGIIHQEMFFPSTVRSLINESLKQIVFSKFYFKQMEKHLILPTWFRERD